MSNSARRFPPEKRPPLLKARKGESYETEHILSTSLLGYCSTEPTLRMVWSACGSATYGPGWTSSQPGRLLLSRVWQSLCTHIAESNGRDDTRQNATRRLPFVIRP